MARQADAQLLEWLNYFNTKCISTYTYIRITLYYYYLII